MCCFSKSIILEKIHEEIFKSKLPDNFIERTPFHGFSHVELLQNFEKLKYQVLRSLSNVQSKIPEKGL